MATKNELRTANKTLETKVEILWATLIDQADTIERKDVLLEDKRVAITDQSAIIGKLRTENAKLKDRLGPPMTGTVSCDVETQHLVDALSPKPLPEEVNKNLVLAIGLLRRVLEVQVWPDEVISRTTRVELASEITQFLEEQPNDDQPE